jgi:Zinc-finger of C2H2 type
MKTEEGSNSVIVVQYVKQEPEIILEDVKLEPEEYSVLVLTSDEEETAVQVQATKKSFSFSSSTTIKNQSHPASEKISFSDIGAFSRNVCKTEKKSFKCPACPETFNLQRLLKFHEARAHATSRNIFNCEICERTFTTEEELSIHKYRHEQESFFCGICEKSMATKYLLDRHVRKKHNSHLCCHCPLMFSLFDRMKTHVLEVHGKKNNKF